MGQKHHKVDAFLAGARSWQDEMTRLREILVDCPMVEDFKWYKPCYVHDGSNVVLIAPFREHCWLLFMQGVLMSDPEALLEPQGPNSRAGRVLKFTSADQVAARDGVIRSYVAEAIALIDSGARVDFEAQDEVEVPEELLAAFEDRPDLQEAFEALTPGRRRFYLIHFGTAKQSATRTARIDKAAPRIFAGKGLNER